MEIDLWCEKCGEPMVVIFSISCSSLNECVFRVVPCAKCLDEAELTGYKRGLQERGDEHA